MRICLNKFLGVPFLSESHWSRLHVGLVTAKFSEWINTAIPFCSLWLFDNNAFICDQNDILRLPDVWIL